MKKQLTKYKISIFVICIILVCPVIVRARYFEKIENIQGKGIIAEPIFKVESLQEIVTETINKKTKPKEYVFKVKNYVFENNGNSKRISQVDMSYNIQVINEKSNFPVRYELYEFETNQNIINTNGKTEDIFIKKDIEYEKKYRLVVFWENKEGLLENNDNIKIIINSNQIK